MSATATTTVSVADDAFQVFLAWQAERNAIRVSVCAVYVLRAHAHIAAISHLKTVIKVKKNSIFSSHLHAEIRFSLSFISFLACAMCCYHI